MASKLFFYLPRKVKFPTDTMSQVWLITGTSSGLGHELARAVLGRGDKVIATARQLDRLSSLKELGAATLQLDVTAPQEELNRKAEEAIAVYGRIDILVNNAGYVQFGTIEETRYDSISSFFWITSRI